MARVYFGNLDPDVQKDEMDDTCNKFGRVSDVWIARNPPGFAFVVGHPFPNPAQLSPLSTHPRPDPSIPNTPLYSRRRSKISVTPTTACAG